MEQKNLLFESNYKKLGFTKFNMENIEKINNETYRPFIKILSVPKDYTISVDFNSYEIKEPSIFFVNSNQYLKIIKATTEEAQLIFYNRDFYCVQIHDAEVACDGLLFNNIFEIPKVDLNISNAATVYNLLERIQYELDFADTSSEEMIRTYIKQLIILSTRLWKIQNLQNEKYQLPKEDNDFFRNFSRFVEIHFREKHSVADYAEMLKMAPKTLSGKFHKQNLENPNEFIKNRIILEAKRLLLYTELSIKEIAYQLGYDDPAYFNRMFTQKTNSTPASFKKTFK